MVLGAVRGFFGWEDGLGGKSVAFGDPGSPHVDRRGKSWRLLVLVQLLHKDRTFRWGETPISAPGQEFWVSPGGRQLPECVHLPPPALGRGALKNKIKKKCVPLQSHALPPNPALQQRFWVAQDLQLLPGAESTGERRSPTGFGL